MACDNEDWEFVSADEIQASMEGDDVDIEGRCWQAGRRPNDAMNVLDGQKNWSTSDAHAALQVFTWRQDSVPIREGRQRQPDEDRRQLCDALWQSQPHWSPKDLASAEKELASVGINSLEALIIALLDNFREKLGRKQRAFGRGAVGSLRRYLGMARGGGLLAPRAHREEPLQQTPLQQTPQRELCNLLWKARPTWTSVELVVAEQQLLAVGVNSVSSLIDKFSHGLNDKLVEAGLKPFRQKSIDALTQTQRQ